MKLRTHFCWLLLFSLTLVAHGQETGGATRQQEVPVRTISPENWTAASKNLDYSKDRPLPPEPPVKRPSRSVDATDWTGFTQHWGTFFQILAIGIALIAIGLAIYKMLQEPRNKVISRDGVEITAANVDAYIQETDLERFLREALASGNHPLAIRMYYLQIIKSLNERHFIEWARQKTNRDYTREMRHHKLAPNFRTLTQTYENVWYGNQSLSKADFLSIEPGFQQFLSIIKN